LYSIFITEKNTRPRKSPGYCVCPNLLMIMLIDENHDKHGPYGFAP